MDRGIQIILNIKKIFLNTIYPSKVEISEKEKYIFF